MKMAIILTILLLIAGCAKVEKDISPKISGVQELMLDEQDLQELGMAKAGDCQAETYATGEYSPLEQYSFCNYTITSLPGTGVVIELSKYTNLNDLNGTYQYQSSHYRSAEGLISENDYGDMSRFYVNNEKDYGGELNPQGVYFYHLYIARNPYLIHITSGGAEEAKVYVANTGQKILSKFD